MKNLILVVALLILGSNAYCQTKNEMLAELNGKYNVDENGNVTIFKVVDSINLSKDEIYNRAMNYFVYNYGSGKSVIQTQDKENGLIVAKGIYSDVHVGISLITTTVSTWHIIRVDVKENKARIIVTLTGYEKVISGGNSPDKHVSTLINQEFPINPDGYNETVMTKAFYKSYKKAITSLDNIEKSIREGNTSKSLENNNW